MRSRALAVITAAAAVAAAPAGPAGTRLDATPVDGGVHVHVGKKGLFSAFAHDHDFEVTRWRGSVELPGDAVEHAAVELVLDAGSLRDQERGVSSGDRQKVDSQTAGPEVLDAARFPEITYRAEGATLMPDAGPGGATRGTLHGALTLHDRTRPVDASFEATRDGGAWRVSGKARFRQSDFGIKPYSGAGGTVGVKDEVEITFTIALRSPVAAR
jgi:polyisoprenoid-binding protein YceI